VVGIFLRRLGLAGAILIVSVFVFGVLAGAVVVNRLQATLNADVQEQGDKAEKAESAEKDAEDKGESKPKHPNNGHGQKQKAPEKSSDNED